MEAFNLLIILGLIAMSLILSVSLYFCIRKIKLTLWFIFGAIITGQLIRIAFINKAGSAVQLIDIALALYVIVGTLRGIILRKSLPKSLAIIFLVGFVIWLPITLLFNSPLLTNQEIILAASYIGRFILLAGTLVVTAWIWTDEVDRYWILKGIMLTSVILIGLGFLQLAVLPSLIELTKYGWDPHVGRMVSTFLDPNYFGMFLVMIFSVILGLLFYEPKSKNRLLSGLLALVTLVSIVLTFSRSAYLALAIATTIILFLRSPRAVILMLMTALLIGSQIPRAQERIVSALTIDETARLRIEAWSETLQIIREYPILGVGYNAFGPAQVRNRVRDDLSGLAAQGTDSSLLFAMATTGSVGVGLYLLFYLALFWESITIWQQTKSWKIKTVSLAMIGIIPAYLVDSQFVNGLFYPYLFVPFALLGGILLGELRRMGKILTNQR